MGYWGSGRRRAVPPIGPRTRTVLWLVNWFATIGWGAVTILYAMTPDWETFRLLTFAGMAATHSTADHFLFGLGGLLDRDWVEWVEWCREEGVNPATGLEWDGEQ